MILKNALVYTPNHQFEKQNLYISNERIVKEGSGEIIEAEGLYALPGFIDIHFHGAMSHDFCDASPIGLQAIADYEASQGILAICPATMTLDESTLLKVMEAARNHPNITGATLVGLNMEGPFISPNKLGAQNAEYVMEANNEMFERLQAKSGNLIKLVDLAPEVGNNMDFIKKNSKNVKISLAHTCADYETASLAFKNGAKHLTHLYNAMNPINHREPGPIIAAYENHSEVELISDGIHVHPSIIKMTFEMFDDDKVCLISDSMRATGLPDGEYSLGGQGVSVHNRKALLTSDLKTIAGSVTNLYDCFRYAVKEAQVPLELAIRAASENPAKSIGIDHEYGMIKEGYYANILLVDKDLNLKHIINKGKLIK